MSSNTFVRVKPTLERWFEDKREETGLSREEVAFALNISHNKLSRVLNDPPTADAAFVRGLAKLFNIGDWFDVLVKGFGFGMATITINEWNQLLHHTGHELDIVQSVAA
jgi:transcriptional regulator with XRE-family HTH domain